MVTFGKHKGKTIYWLCNYDPSYALWAYDKGLIVLTEDEKRIATEIKFYRYMENVAFELQHENWGDR
jgi:hypothetical protein